MAHRNQLPIVLGSRSPRRRELLSLLVAEERILVVPPCDPSEPGFAGLRDDDAIRQQLLRIASLKRDGVQSRPECPRNALILTGDTTIMAGEPQQRVVLGQPPESADWTTVVRQWFRDYYLGHSHWALTAVVLTVVEEGQIRQSWNRVVETEVHMGAASDELIDWYLSTGEPLGKAGGYALQGAGSVFISRVTGSLSNVVGLPLEAVRELLQLAENTFQSQPSGECGQESPHRI